MSPAIKKSDKLQVVVTASTELYYFTSGNEKIGKVWISQLKFLPCIPPARTWLCREGRPPLQCWLCSCCSPDQSKVVQLEAQAHVQASQICSQAGIVLMNCTNLSSDQFPITRNEKII